MKQWTIILFVLFLVACSSASTDESLHESITVMLVSDLPYLGKAPELTNEVWLNSIEPLRLADLKGQVILLDMWTFG